MIDAKQAAHFQTIIMPEARRIETDRCVEKDAESVEIFLIPAVFGYLSAVIRNGRRNLA
jgi:hypothetical protein